MRFGRPFFFLPPTIRGYKHLQELKGFKRTMVGEPQSDFLDTGIYYFLCFGDDIFREIWIVFWMHWNKHEQIKVIMEVYFWGAELTFSHLTRQAMKEILLAGDTNRLVAELTFVSWRFLAVDESKAESVRNFH